jgi:hypothetical protein
MVPTTNQRFDYEARKYIAMDNQKVNLDVTRELRAIATNIQEISDSIDRLSALLGQSAVQVPLRSRSVRRSPVRKKITMRNGVVERIKKIPSTRIVHDIITASANDVDIRTLMKKTGYDQRKIYNIAFRLKNQGKIRSAGHGVYGKL